MHHRRSPTTATIRALALFAGGLAAFALTAAASAQTAACADDPVYHIQDFAMGDWDVYSGTKKTAEVRLEPVLAGCAVRETWTALSGKGNGIGLFTYSHVLKAWTYAWASDAGAATLFTGAASGAHGMLYVTQRPTDAGGTRLRHWTLAQQADGGIRELSVGSEDGGTTWTPEYELAWRKHAQ